MNEGSLERESEEVRRAAARTNGSDKDEGAPSEPDSGIVRDGAAGRIADSERNERPEPPSQPAPQAAPHNGDGGSEPRPDSGGDERSHGDAPDEASPAGESASAGGGVSSSEAGNANGRESSGERESESAPAVDGLAVDGLADPLRIGEVPEAADSAGDGANAPKRRRGAAAALAAVLCVFSAAAFLCTGIFVAEALSRAGGALFYTGFAAAPPIPEEESSDSESAVDTAPDDDEPQDTQSDSAADTAPKSETRSYPVEHASLAAQSLTDISNMTDYEPDGAALCSAEAFAAAAPSPSEGPAVLIVHTHATEAYIADGLTEYNESTSFRSVDPDFNMIAVGEQMKATLEAAGIKTLHCTELLDAEDFERSYEFSAAAVREYLEKYPSVRVVLDVHRDAIFHEDGTLIAPTSADGAAQVMIVCGTDEQGAVFPDWRENLSFAFCVQAAARSKYPDLMRGVNLRGASFNEQLAERYLLVEIGSAGNTLSEAKEGARRFAEALAEAIGGEKSEE